MYARYITDKNCQKLLEDKITSIIIGDTYEGNFALLLDNYPDNENVNHFQSIYSNNGIKIINEKLDNIKNEIIIINILI